jgi:hypothetical protein
MKVVMLDVDGVLNNVHDMRENLESGRALDHKNWNAESCAALAEIVRKTDDCYFFDVAETCILGAASSGMVERRVLRCENPFSMYRHHGRKPKWFQGS